jgi:hypothetical protein
MESRVGLVIVTPCGLKQVSRGTSLQWIEVPEYDMYVTYVATLVVDDNLFLTFTNVQY